VTVHPTAVRELGADELSRANAIYAEVGFVPSVAPRDTTYALFDGDALTALGRVNRYDDGAVEIGGFFVDPARRGTGLAQRIVSAVLDRVAPGVPVWCVPYQHLAKFYQGFGLMPVPPDTLIPDSITAKCATCNANSAASGKSPTTLLLRPA
jgi:GNAT superfamily N-acetyltransferase